MKIDKFRDEHFFLSNFYIHPIIINGREYKSSEHYFQACKMLRAEDHDLVSNQELPGLARKLAHLLPMRDDWDQVKDNIMRQALKEKFADPELKSKLLSTAPAELIEGNWWHDTYWGIDQKTGEGKNMLGHLLMELRDTL